MSAPNSHKLTSLTLAGCGPVPLASYLKALGVLRILSEQYSESQLRGAWRNEQFVLLGEIDREVLMSYLLNNYIPSAIVAPWNGGSGFHSKDNKTAIKAIQVGGAKRFEQYRLVIGAAVSALEQLGLDEKPGPELKETLLKLCRNTFPDEALGWLDAAFVLTQSGVRYPPLLGTGGNDGRLDFTNNYMQRLTEVIDPESGEPQEGAESLLSNALFGDVVSGLSDKAIGQFGPASAGGANASSGFSAKALVNPWDFILMLEGAILFAATSVKRLGSTRSGQLAYPFSVRTTGAGYGSASSVDEADSRCEMWMPLWSAPATCGEIRSLLSEGRAQVGMRPVRDGLDFHRAITALGVDRGIDAFQRYGFLVRNGLAYFATPMERVPVRRNTPAVQLLADLDCDNWLDKFRNKAKDANAPGSVARSCRELERAIIAFCSASQADETAAQEVRQLLIALGHCEAAMANSMDWTISNSLKPVPLLSPDWLSAGARADDPAMVEYRLAAALASLTLTRSFGEARHPVREHMEAVDIKGSAEQRWVNWATRETRDVVGLDGRLVDRLNAIVHRRLLLSGVLGNRNWQENSAVSAEPADLAAFIEGATDDALLKDFIWGLSLIDWASPFIAEHRPKAPRSATLPDTFFSLLKLCHPAPSNQDNESLPLNPAIHRLAASGASDEAARLAIRQLRNSGMRLGFREIHGFTGQPARASAAILFPLWHKQLDRLRRKLVPAATVSAGRSSEYVQQSSEDAAPVREL